MYKTHDIIGGKQTSLSVLGSDFTLVLAWTYTHAILFVYKWIFS
jgi:hypothetical protein